MIVEGNSDPEDDMYDKVHKIQLQTWSIHTRGKNPLL